MMLDAPHVVVSHSPLLALEHFVVQAGTTPAVERRRRVLCSGDNDWSLFHHQWRRGSGLGSPHLTLVCCTGDITAAAAAKVVKVRREPGLFLFAAGRRRHSSSLTLQSCLHMKILPEIFTMVFSLKSNGTELF